MATRRVVALFALLLAVCVIFSLPAFSSNARIVRLSYTEGDVRIDRNIGQGLERAILNMPITQGSRLDTGEDGRVEVEFENGSTLRMTGAGSIVFRELSLTGRGDKVSYLDVHQGLLYFDIKHKGDDDFRVSFGSQNVRVNRNAHFRLDVADIGVSVAVYKGEVALEGLTREVEVRSNETLTIDPEDASRYFLAKGITADSEDAWDEQRRDYRDQYASRDQDYRYANSYYGAPYSYGLADLSYYGNYFNAPGYGWVWRPSAFGSNWDPFNDGAWTWYPGAGWVFISSQPWGWAPYRYGEWVFVNGYGWCWSPARRYNYWNPVPVIRHAPRAFVAPAPPRRGSGPTVLIGGGFRTHGPGPTPPPRWPHRGIDNNGKAGGVGTPIWPGRGGTPTGVTRPGVRDGNSEVQRDREGPRPGSGPSVTPGTKPPLGGSPGGRMDTPRPDRPPAADGRRGPDVDNTPRRGVPPPAAVRDTPPSAPVRDITPRRDAPPPREAVPDRDVTPRRETPPPAREVAPDRDSTPRREASPARDITPPARDTSPRMSTPPASTPRTNVPTPRFSAGPTRFGSGGGNMGGHGGRMR